MHRAARFLKSPLGIAIAALGVLASVGAVWDGYWGTRPEIHALGPDPSSAFALPFAVKNPSHFFAMEDVQWFCGIKKVEFSRNNSLEQLSITEPPSSSIGPGETRNFRCRIGVKSADVKSGSLALFVQYKTFYIPRVSAEQPMTWLPDASPPRWVEGEIGGVSAKP